MTTFARHFKSIADPNELVVVSPDSGGANRARAFAQRLKCDLAIGDKRRSGNNDSAELLNIIGNVEGKTAILFDDIIDTGGSLTKVAHALQKNGATRIFAACSHGILSGPAIQRLEDSPIEKLFITNTVPLDETKRACSKVEQLSIAEMLAIAIKKIHIEESLSILFR
jgi:ribose-phosphate pyrophosphokinase